MSVSRQPIMGASGTEATNAFVGMREPSGYPINENGEIDRGKSVLSWDNTTRTLTISPTGESFVFYANGKIFQSAGASVQIDDTEGTWFFYFDENGDFVATQAFNINIIYSLAFTALVYWDADNKTIIGEVFDERHGAKLDGHAHGWLHSKFGTRHNSGAALNSLSSEQTGNLDSHAQFGIDAGIIYDEDIIFNIEAVLSTVGVPIWYLEGSEPKLRSITNTGFSIATTGSGRMAYNQNVAGTWQLTEIANNDFGLCHIFCTSGPNTTGRVYAVMGQNDYGNALTARQGAKVEIKNLISVLPTEEKDFIATLIFQTSDGYGNAVKSRLRVNDLGEDWLDWRLYDYKDFNKAVTE